MPAHPLAPLLMSARSVSDAKPKKTAPARRGNTKSMGSASRIELAQRKRTVDAAAAGERDLDSCNGNLSRQRAQLSPRDHQVRANLFDHQTLCHDFPGFCIGIVENALRHPDSARRRTASSAPSSNSSLSRRARWRSHSPNAVVSPRNLAPWRNRSRET